ncbi:3-(3-hydroxy-phenyl)propionate hydroxylase [Nocardia amikacinitolerans]|uniref:bifunctional 3-(3-hydroxy-phenyl)propionate/3-hydroxycinnamic acid hydroxylase MhpA n=1 Tax=Nocardia amikacinitolerans TaxID=756689 RepID=UPI0008375394|nr:bifunctional 3-(3-hydroxy-phenyl)propionate/3-hydroxycinnamic acid hydroxylase [Nocardia amikacinitolerans]MCP2320136.1 3-(3-hydroxy-phenyl)propionate hydroxylase [Nocardia amikacinitolerans]
MSDNEIYDVAVIGYGPVGQTMAALLGSAGHTVAVFERWPSLYGRARAGHIDHEIMRIFQSIGIAERLEEDMFRANKYVFRNAEGETLMTFDWDRDGISGWPSDYIMYQPYIEDALDDKVRDLTSVNVFRGWEAASIERHTDHVQVEFRSVHFIGHHKVLGDDARTVRAKYLVGADGANSTVRAHIGSTQTDFGFRETWLVCDLEPLEPLDFGFDNGQICDPARPHCLFQLGKRHRRFEFALLPGESAEQMNDADVAWKLMAPYGVSERNAKLVRQAVYTFQSKLADRWRDGRIFLAGDAAHVMPPFMGQGMCSGVRDAKALAWRLSLALRGIGGAGLFDSYQTERAPHVAALIGMSIEAGRVSCTFDPDVAAARDEAFRRGDVPPPAPFPHLTGGLLGADSGTGVAGTLAPQGRIATAEFTGRFDDVFGASWVLLLAPGVAGHLDAQRTAALEHLGGKIVTLSAPGAGGEVVDVDGYYAAYFAEHGLAAILYRPDFYVFAATSDPGAIASLVDDLEAKLGALVPAEAVG